MAEKAIQMLFAVQRRLRNNKTVVGAFEYCACSRSSKEACLVQAYSKQAARSNLQQPVPLKRELHYYWLCKTVFEAICVLFCYSTLGDRFGRHLVLPDFAVVTTKSRLTTLQAGVVPSTEIIHAVASCSPNQLMQLAAGYSKLAVQNAC